MKHPIQQNKEADLHSHKCGWTALGQLDGYGCGHVWSHERNESKTMTEDHKCPKCGCGPFTFIFIE